MVDFESSTTREKTRSDESAWASAEPVFLDGVLFINGIPAVCEEERALQELLVSSTVQSGDKVVEVGYGYGFASSAIQSSAVPSHQIIEANRILAAQASLDQPRASILECFWHTASERTWADADAVLWDPCPLFALEEPQRAAALRHLRPIWETVLPCLKSGARVGALDPSGELTVADLNSFVGHELGRIELISNLDVKANDQVWWFSNGVQIVLFERT